MKKFLLTLVATAIFAYALPAFSASIPDKPAKASLRNTAVAVEAEGNDSIGAQLSTRLKESFNASNLFTLSGKDEPKIRVLISTVPEFPSRPSVGSAYTIIWLFSQSEGTLRHFLMHETGVISSENVDGLAAQIVERTDGISARYGYLFQN